MTRRTGPDRATREQVWWRDRDRCVMCGKSTRQIHHRRPRGMGGTRDPLVNDPSNLLLLCGSGTTGCHGWVESHRAEALRDGWLVSKWGDPAAVPISVGHRAIWLGHDGKTYPEISTKETA